MQSNAKQLSRAKVNRSVLTDILKALFSSVNVSLLQQPQECSAVQEPMASSALLLCCPLYNPYGARDLQCHASFDTH